VSTVNPQKQLAVAPRPDMRIPAAEVYSEIRKPPLNATDQRNQHIAESTTCAKIP
jgi:hypothetical protein